MKRLIAIDGGASKTDAVLFNENGDIIQRVRLEGCNPNDIGFQGAATVLKNTLDSLLEKVGGRKVQLESAFAGLSGGTIGDYRGLFQKLLCDLLPNTIHIDSNSDAISALSSGAGHTDGCVVISGTGSVGFARLGKSIYRVGGWGYLFDRGGSAYDFGRDALYYTLCAYDGRSEATVLTGILEEKFGIPVPKIVSMLYEQGKTKIASLAPLVFQALRRGDKLARRITDENMHELAKVINAVSDYMVIEPFVTVLTGSMFKDFADMKPFLLKYLKKEHQFVLPELPPVYGAAVEAMAQAEIEIGLEFKNRFKESLKI